MALDLENDKIPYQSDALAHGGEGRGNDVGSARMYLDPSTGRYIWGWPVYKNGRLDSVTPAASSASDPLLDDRSFLRNQVNNTARSLYDTMPGGGGGGGGVPGTGRTVSQFVQSLLPSAVNTIGGIVSQTLQNRANQEAQNQQLAATREALALQERMYNQSRADLAPYRTIGNAAMGPLGHFLGLPGYERGNEGIQPRAANPPMPPPTVAPSGASSSTPATLGGLLDPHRETSLSAAPGTVMMEAPDGTRQAVPSAQVDHYRSLGAKVVQ